MAERLYEVSVTQAMEMIHVVRAPNKREARRIIQDLTRALVLNRTAPASSSPSRAGTSATRRSARWSCASVNSTLTNCLHNRKDGTVARRDPLLRVVHLGTVHRRRGEE